MNNRFKFRVWDTISKKMYLWPILIDNYIGDQNVILEQFTGLLDQNGTEIFEGDIIKYGFDNKIYTEFVKWEYGCFYILTKNEDSANPLMGTNTVCQVIGNIHENPELLK